MDSRVHPSGRQDHEESADAAKRPRDDARTGYTPPAARGRRTDPSCRDDAAKGAASARKVKSPVPGAARDVGGRRRDREETDEEYSATGKGTKDSRRETRDPVRRETGEGCRPLRKDDEYDAFVSDRRQKEEYNREYPDAPDGTQVHLTQFPVNLDDRSHLALFWDMPGLVGARVRRTLRGRSIGHAGRAAYRYLNTAD